MRYVKREFRDGPLEARFLIKGICCASCAETAAEAAIVTMKLIWIGE